MHKAIVGKPPCITNGIPVAVVSHRHHKTKLIKWVSTNLGTLPAGSITGPIQTCHTQENDDLGFLKFVEVPLQYALPLVRALELNDCVTLGRDTLNNSM